MQDIPVRKIESKTTAHNELYPVKILSIQQLTNGQPHSEPLHRHDFYYLLIIESGTGSHVIDFHHYNITSGCIFVLKPGQVHQLELNANCTGYIFQFHKNYFTKTEHTSYHILRKVAQHNLYMPPANVLSKVIYSCAHSYTENSEKPEEYSEIIKANLSILLISLYRLQPQESQPLSYSTQLDEFIELIESHIHEHKQVSYYADRLHLSNYQLNHITKKKLNKNASELINEHIILEAKKYLVTTPMQVNEIAYLLGYQDPSYFIRFFKKHTHHSPEMFRKNYPEVLPY